MIEGRFFAATIVGSASSPQGSRARLRPLAIALLCCGCSPVAFARGSSRAERALREAEAAQADAHAPYELTRSKLYLEKAREESAEAHYALALALLRRAEHNAQRARALSEARAPAARERTPELSSESRAQAPAGLSSGEATE